MTATHPFERLTCPAGDEVRIDPLQVSLIRLLWARGVSTIACCQGDPGEGASIVFPSAADLETTLAVLYDAAPVWMRDAIAMRPGVEGRWSVDSWAKLWWSGSKPASVYLDGPAPFYYGLTIASGHTEHLTEAGTRVAAAEQA